MDQREMKKHILATALQNYYRLVFQGSFTLTDPYEEVKIMTDREATDANVWRFEKVLQEMVENAESKLD